ncbi:MAG: ABC transporter ATP-binding protein [Rhodothermales bacterium]
MDDRAVDIQQVTHRYGDHVALQNVSFTVSSGMLFGLLGPNGGGKTTLFRILSTLLAPSNGTVHVFGYDTRSAPTAVRRRIGAIFQHPALDDDLTTEENLRVQGALYGMHGISLRHRIDELLEVFDLTNRRKDRVKTLSGGLQRRVDLVRGLLHRPPLLLLDEPTTGLDPVARRAFWQALARLRREEGTTMMVATHLMEEAELCDEVGIIDRGHLVALGTPTTLKHDLGGETLWLETHNTRTLCDHIQAQFGLDARVIGDTVQISHPEAHTMLASLFEAFGSQIDSAMVRKPTLEDVFMVHAGHRFEEHSMVLNA